MDAAASDHFLQGEFPAVFPAPCHLRVPIVLVHGATSMLAIAHVLSQSLVLSFHIPSLSHSYSIATCYLPYMMTWGPSLFVWRFYLGQCVYFLNFPYLPSIAEAFLLCLHCVHWH